MTPQKRSKALKYEAKKSSGMRQHICLSISMERSFVALKDPEAREAYVEAHLVNSLAHQIRILREKRGWTQRELARRVGTSQNTISRLEDPSYGRYTIRTLLDLGKAFDVAFFVRYLPFSEFMQRTWDTKPENFMAASYPEEASSIQFIDEDRVFTEGPQLFATMLTNQTVPTFTGICMTPSFEVTAFLKAEIGENK